MDYKKFIYIFTLFFILGCGSNKNTEAQNQSDVIPDWINNYKKNYPDIRYISYLSISNSKIIAEKQAMTGISAQFEVAIKSNLNSQEKITETNDVINKEYSLNEDIQIVSEQELKNIKISEVYSDIKNNKFYILATLDKMETSKIYLNEVSKLEADFKTYYNNFEKETDIIEKYKLVNKCLHLENQIKIINSKLEVLGSKRLEHSKYENLFLSKRKLMNNITFNISEEDKNIYLSLKNSITNLGFSVVNSNSTLSIKYFSEIKQSSVQNKDVVFINWNITINVLQGDKILLSYKKNGRSSQKNVDSAIEMAYYDIEKDILEKYSEYLNNNL